MMANQPTKNNEDAQRAAPVQVVLEITERGYLQSAKDIYTNRLTFLREMFQNASDSGATVFNVRVGQKEIVMSDNGKGMSSDFVRNEFKKIGERFKTEDGQIGQYGLGRMSVWGPLIYEKDGEVKYKGHIEIVTRDGAHPMAFCTWQDNGVKKEGYVELKQAEDDPSKYVPRRDASGKIQPYYTETKLIWKNLAQYEVVVTGVSTQKGTEVHVLSDAFLGMGLPAYQDIRLYLLDNIISTKVDVKIDNYPLNWDGGKGWRTFNANGEEEITNVQFGVRPTYKYEVGVDYNKKLIIAEKGLKIDEILDVGVGGSINFIEGTWDGKPMGTKPLNREGTMLNKEEVLYIFYRDAVIPYIKSLSKTTREVRTAEFLDIHEKMVELQNKLWRGELFTAMLEKGKNTDISRELLSVIIFEGKELQEWVKTPKVVWSKKKDRLTAIATNLGYKVLCTFSDERMAHAMVHTEIPSILTIKDDLENAFRIRGAVNETERSGLDRLSNYVQILSYATGDAENAREEQLTTKKPVIDAKQLPSEIQTLGPGVTQNGISLYLAEHKDYDVKTFIYRKMVMLNTNNEFVHRCLQMKRTDLLLPEILASYTQHKTEYGWGNNYEGIYRQLLRNLYNIFADTQLTVVQPVQTDDNGGMFLPPVRLENQKIADGEELDVLVRTVPIVESPKPSRFSRLKGIFLRKGADKDAAAQQQPAEGEDWRSTIPKEEE